MLRYTRKNKNLKIPVGIGINNNIDASVFYDISDADAMPNDLIIGKTAYSAEGFIVGTLNLNEEKENSYNEGYSTGAEAGYDNGYSVGEQEGYNDGFSVGKSEGLEEGYDNGYSVGKTEGYNDGYSIGKTDGTTEGYNNGFSEGKAEGLEEGREDGFADGKTEGLEEGYNNGFEVGKTEGYNDGYSVGKTDGTTEGYNNGFSVGKTEGLEEGYNDGYSVGNEAGYNTGKTDGIEEGRDEIIEQQSDATITPETVIQGFIGYGANNTRIVGTATQGGGSGGDGFDFTQIGYTQTESNNLNAVTADALAYTKTLYPVDVTGKTSLYRLYQGNTELVYAPYIDTSNITNMGYMFNNCSNLIFAPKYDYSKVTTVEKMFSYTNVSEIDLSDASTVTNFSQVASYNPGITKLIINAASATGNGLYSLIYGKSNCKYLKIFNISNKLTTFNKNSFNGSSSLENLEYVEFQGDTSNVKTETAYQDWFYNCKKLKTVILDIDTHFITNIEDMFYNCETLESIPLFNTSNVNNMYRTFYNCKKLTSVPQIDTSKVTNMSNTFYNCASLQTIPLLDTSNVDVMSATFRYCSSLTSIPQIDTSKVTSTAYMFGNCSSLTDIPLLNFESANSISYMFANCGKVTNLGGFKDLGKAYTSSTTSSNGSLNLSTIPSNVLTKESVLNVFNNLYDISNLTNIYRIQLNSGFVYGGILSAEDIAIATNKGWTVQ